MTTPVEARPSPTEAVRRAHRRIAADPRAGIWIALVDPDAALDAAAGVERRLEAGEHLPLAGLTLAVKNNIDVAGLDTTAGCPAYAYRPDGSATAVRRLETAGAVVIGVTNLDQFATGLVGTRSPYGICPNAHWDGLIAGGSSSGSAVAVATGMVDLALGTDTAGSGRIPAAANGIVGLKPTRGALSTSGVVPACASLDCVSVFARTVELAEQAMRSAAGPGPDAMDSWSRPRPSAWLDAPEPGTGRWRVGVPRVEDLDFDGSEVDRRGFLDSLSGPGFSEVELVETDISALLRAGRLLYDGAFVAERYTAVGEFIDDHPDEVDPVVGPIIAAGGRLRAADLFDDLARLEALRRAGERMWDETSGLDAIVVPTAPRIPTVAEVLAGPVSVNSMLGTYTNFVNLLDQCALAVPVPSAGPRPPTGRTGPPPSITLIAPAWRDATLVSLARTLTRPAGRTDGPASPPTT